MAKVIIYTTNYCRFCFRAKTFLRSKEVQFEEIDVTYDAPRRPKWSVCLPAEQCRKSLLTANRLVVTTIFGS
jgi:arsenate reductase-like glutaredoxin family protein